MHVRVVGEWSRASAEISVRNAWVMRASWWIVECNFRNGDARFGRPRA